MKPYLHQGAPSLLSANHIIITKCMVNLLYLYNMESILVCVLVCIIRECGAVRADI